MELSEEAYNLIGKIDEINEFNQAIYLADDFVNIINKLKENFDNYLISNQDEFIDQIEDFMDELRERDEISFKEVEEIYSDIWAEFSNIELDMIELSELL
jgi:methionyl-tRNA synthetase